LFGLVVIREGILNAPLTVGKNSASVLLTPLKFTFPVAGILPATVGAVYVAVALAVVVVVGLFPRPLLSVHVVTLLPYRVMVVGSAASNHKEQVLNVAGVRGVVAILFVNYSIQSLIIP
jgi:hypothetical protein